MALLERIKRRRQRQLVKYLLVLGTVVATGLSFWGIFFSRLFLIQDVKVSNAQTVDTREVASIANSFLAGKRFGVLPKNHLLFLNEKLLIAAIQEKFWRLAEISPKYNYQTGTLMITLKERKPIAYWCTKNTVPAGDSRNADSCLLADEKGVLFERVDDYGGDLILKIYDGTGRSLRPGVRGIDEETMIFLALAKERLKPTVEITAITIEKDSIGAHYVKIHSQDGWYFLADTKTNPDEIVSTLRILLSKEIGEKINRLEYIDLRVPGRAYYKLR